jgi:hypothetical protein
MGVPSGRLVNYQQVIVLMHHTRGRTQGDDTRFYRGDRTGG